MRMCDSIISHTKSHEQLSNRLIKSFMEWGDRFESRHKLQTNPVGTTSTGFSFCVTVVVQIRFVRHLCAMENMRAPTPLEAVEHCRSITARKGEITAISDRLILAYFCSI